jgi:hypothetical protein
MKDGVVEQIEKVAKPLLAKLPAEIETSIKGVINEAV